VKKIENNHAHRPRPSHRHRRTGGEAVADAIKNPPASPNLPEACQNFMKILSESQN